LQLKQDLSNKHVFLYIDILILLHSMPMYLYHKYRVRYQ